MTERNEFITYLYEICDMGVRSTKTLVDIIKDKENKIINLLNDELDEYEVLLKRVKKLLKLLPYCSFGLPYGSLLQF